MQALHVWKATFISMCLIGFLVTLCVLAPSALATVATDTTATFPIADKLTVTQATTNLAPDSNYTDEVTVKATDSNGVAVKDVVLDVFVSAGDARIYATKTTVGTDLSGLKTDAKGEVKFSIITGHDAEFKLRIVPHGGDGSAQVAKIVDLSFETEKYKDALSSNRSFLELFIGQTFANNYDKTTGNNTGFGDAGQLIQLTFDTMWKRPSALWRTPCPPESMADCTKPTPTRHDGLIHTELNLSFMKFPFGPPAPAKAPGATAAATDTTPANQAAPLENAFTGTLGLIWQPDSWASYSNTSRDADFKYDAVRWGIFARAGMTTRAEKSATGDTAIGRGQLGLRFTHNHTNARSGDVETVNYIPVRFVEVSYGWFEQFQGARTYEAHRRLVIDGGIRLVPLSNKIIPFYAGIHANVGKGPDDVRVFAGFLFKLDKLAELFSSAAP